MATLQQIEAALRAADAAGNTEDARVLAQEYARLRAAPKAAPEPEVAPDPTEGMSGLDKYRAGIGKSLMDTVHGLRQAATEAIAMPLSGVANIYGVGGENAASRGLNAPARKAAELRAEESQRKVEDAPLMRSGAGLGGYATGSILQLLGPAALARGTAAAPAMLPRTITGNALQGAAFGAIQPVGTEDSRTANTLVGTAAGGVGAALPQLLSTGVRAGRAVLEPITRAGQERIVGRAIQRSATDASRLTQAAPSAIPGVQRTLAEETADPGIGLLQRQFTSQLADQMAGNNAARAQAVRGAFEGADDASISSIRAGRDAQAGQVLGGLSGAAVPDMAPFRQAIESGISANQGNPAAQKALQEVLSEIPEVKTADQAYNVRKYLDFILSKQSDKPAAKAASRELQQAKGVLDQEMAKVFPEWGDYLTDYTAQSRRMDQAKVGKSLLGMARQSADPNTSERTLGANALSRAANDPDALVRGATRFGKSTASNTLTPEQSGLLRMLGDDASRMDYAATGGRAVGSDTAQNLATRNILSTLAGGSKLANLALQSQPAQRIAALGEKTYGLLGVPDRLQSVMVEALSDPARARQILGRLPVADRSIVEEALSNVSRRLAVGAVPALTE